ncbi:MAG: septal ring lytic transglycosylase RlpA family protein [Gammaproteobacteria bacterium]|nr:septal ring lytic transglycosylase RlpA family protein [Gammaproteobacteria bacterium]
MKPATRPFSTYPGRLFTAGLMAAALTAGGCAMPGTYDGPPRGAVHSRDLPADAVPRKEPKSRYGNPPFYEVYGKRYRVMESSYGYQERGVASWYGKKFHGRKTSSQEPYNMYAMTAAHKTLPLPTYVRVRNLRNNRSIVVRVNDRGPFVANRIIDLSYSAAAKLDMLRDGTSLVEVTALSYDEAPPPANDVPVRAPSAKPPADAVAATPQPPEEEEHQVYVQAGAFGDATNAERRYALLRSNGVSTAFVFEDDSRSPPLYRVRIGPIREVEQYDAVVSLLGDLGISDSHLVTD